MSHLFLSQAWYAEYEALKAGVEIPAPLQALVVNLNVREAHGQVTPHQFRGGFVQPGHSENAAATISASLEITYRVMIGGDIQAAMPALFSGKLKVQGDRAALIKLGMIPDTDSQKAFRQALKAITRLE